jgi:hypothetical protein
MEWEHKTATDEFPTQLAIRPTFHKTPQFRGGGVEPPKPPLGTPLICNPN